MASRVKSSPVSSTLSTRSRRRSETSIPSADSTPQARGTTTRVMPSSSAIAVACSGPAPPNASSARSRGSTPRSTVMTRTARAISSLATRTMPAAQSIVVQAERRASAPTAARRPRRRARRRRPAATARRGTRAAGSRRSRSARRRRARRRRPGSAPGRPRSDAQRAAGVAPGDRPAAGADRVHVDHRQRERAAADLAPAGGGDAPSRATDTSHDVPPMSSATTSPAPACAPVAAAPTAPPAGPVSTVHDPCRAAVSASTTPPPDSTISGAGRPASRRAVGQPLQVAAQQRRDGGVDDVVAQRSYSRNTPAASCESRRGCRRSRQRSRDRRSWSWWRKPDSRQTAADSTSSRQVDPRARAARPRRARGARRRPACARARRRAARAARAAAGGPAHSRYRSARAWRPSSSRSVNPSVANSAVRAPLPSSRALVPTVIPWTKRSTSPADASALLQRGLDRVDHPARLVVGRGRRLGRDQPAVGDQDGVGERPANVDAEQHAAERYPARRPGSGPCPTLAAIALCLVPARLARSIEAARRGACATGSTLLRQRQALARRAPCGCWVRQSGAVHPDALRARAGSTYIVATSDVALDHLVDARCGDSSGSERGRR